MFRNRHDPGPLDLQLSEADLIAQLPAIARVSDALPVRDWDRAWQAFVQRKFRP